MHDSVLLSSLSAQSFIKDTALDPTKTGIRQEPQQLTSGKLSDRSFSGSSIPMPLDTNKNMLNSVTTAVDHNTILDSALDQILMSDSQETILPPKDILMNNEVLTNKISVTSLNTFKPGVDSSTALLPSKQRLSEMGDDRHYTQCSIAVAVECIPEYKLSKNCATCAFSIWDESCKVALCVAYNNVPVLDNYVCSTYLDPATLLQSLTSSEIPASVDLQLNTETNSQIVLTDKALHQKAIELSGNLSNLLEAEAQLQVIKNYRSLYIKEYGDLKNAFDIK